MTRKLILVAAIVSIAGIGFGQTPNSPFDINPFAGGEVLGATGFLDYTYHNEVVLVGGSGLSTVWQGHEWGQGHDGHNGVAYDPNHAMNTTIGANMCTMGIYVVPQQGVRLNLYERFFEWHPGPVHSVDGESITITFTGDVGTNTPINIGLNAIGANGLQFAAAPAGPEVTGIRGTLNGVTHTFAPGAAQAYMLHQFCNVDFQFEIDVTVPTHFNQAAYLPFYFCPADPSL